MLRVGRRRGSTSPTHPTCVLGDIDLVRALGLAGIRSTVMSRAGSPSRYSRATSSVLKHADARTETELRVERLLAFAADQPSAPVLFYDGDWDALMLARFAAQLKDAFRFVSAAPDLVEELTDKARFQVLARRLGLPVPRAVRLLPGTGGAPAIDLCFPVVVKPLSRHQSTWGAITRGKAIRVGDEDELAALGDRLAEHGVEVLVQEAVTGPETRIESYHVYVDSKGAVVAEFTGRKLRTYPRGYGYSTAVEITDANDVRRAGRTTVEAIGLTGVAKLDFKRDEQERLHLLEVNPRFSLWHHPAALAGVNIPAIVHADLTDSRRPPVRALRTGVRWCSPSNDLRAARSDGWSAVHWLRWAAGCEAKSGFAWSDPLPLPRALMTRAWIRGT